MLSENDKSTSPNTTPLDLLPQHLADLRKSGLERFANARHTHSDAGTNP